jgi:hypothetical protein
VPPPTLNNNQQLPVLPYGPGALVPRRPPLCEFEHRGAEFLPKKDAQQRRPSPDPAVRVAPSEIANLTLYYAPEFISQPKATTHHKYTTFETVSAHLWRKITLSRGRSTSPLTAACGWGPTPLPTPWTDREAHTILHAYVCDVYTACMDDKTDQAK